MIVVLVARKPVRMFQALGVDPAPGALVVSDLAIPFMGDAFSGARVAVVDDVVNVGSTLRRVCRRARAAGASEVRAFAISHLERENPLSDLEVCYSGVEGLDEFDLRQFGRRIPQTLQWHSKPYDLTFPVMERTLATPFTAFDNLLAALRGRYGSQYVYDLSTSAGSIHGKRRCAVDLTNGPNLRKLNLYIDEPAETCTLVPIALTTVLSSEGPSLPPSPWAVAIWDKLSSLAPVEDRESMCRLNLFVDGLSLGESFIAENSNFLLGSGRRPFSSEDAELAFGPAILKAEPTGGARHRHWSRSDSGEGRPVTSPFLAIAEEKGLVDEVARLARGKDPLSIFIIFFEELNRRIGANEPSAYEFGWPYSYEEIQAEPCLRLRIGPTIADLVAIVDSLTETNELSATRRRVTRLLDRYIDSGGVVPTVTTYEGSVYRIYRQGEASTREDVSQKVRYAWHAYGKPLSLTRATKYLTILALDLPQTDSQMKIEAAPRGNTLCFHESILDSRTEITHYLRNTKQLREAGEE